MSGGTAGKERAQRTTQHGRDAIKLELECPSKEGST